MIMQKEYLEDMKEHIKSMNEDEFTRRGTTKEAVLNSGDIMKRLWYVYQKDVEDYDCDKEFSLGDAVDEVIGAMPAQKKAPALYRCPFCGSERFIGHQVMRTEVYVDGNGEFDGDFPGGMEMAIYDSGHPYGPFICSQCSQEFDELPENKQIRLPRGTFIVISGETVQKFKKAGYGYSHEDHGYTVVSDGKKAVAVSDQDYNRYYGGQRSFML